MSIEPGQRFGRLTAIERAAPNRWRFKCDCGNEKVFRLDGPQSGNSRSCGCLHREISSRPGRSNPCYRHGLRRAPEYPVWNMMRQRCGNPNNKSFPDYGGRGIVVCESWQTFANFYRDMGPRPSAVHTIERVNNDGHYEPSNVRWATRLEQAKNKRRVSA